MAINLKNVLSRKLEPKQGGDVFTFESVGDQLVAEFKGRRTVRTQRGDDSDLVDVKIIGGEKFDQKSKKVASVKPGDAVFFLGTNLKSIFDAEKPGVGDTIHVQLADIVKSKNGMKVYGFEFVERVSKSQGVPF